MTRTQVSQRRFAQTMRIFPVWTPVRCLPSCKKHYRGVAKLGIDALVLKTKGFDCKDIAVLYHTSSNNVGAWISRAAKKLRSDPDFLDAFDIAC